MGINIGSWGTPEFGVSEFLSKLLGKPLNSQGGSNLLGPSTPSSTSSSWGSSPVQSTPQQQTPVSRPVSSSVPISIPNSTQVPSSTPQPNNNEFNSQIDSLYQPGIDLLNQQQSLLGNQKSTALQGLDDQATELKNTLNQQTGTLQTNLQSQEKTIEEGKRSAMDQALRDYSALQQQTQSRFGQGTGAGAFLSDIQGSELLRNKSTIQKSYDSTMAGFLDQSTKIQQAAFDKANQIEREVMTGKKQIEDEFQSRLLAISSDRTQMETAKSQQKMQLLQETIQRSRALADARESSLFNLQIWKSQQGAQVQSGMNDLNNNYKQMLLEQQGNINNATSEQPYSALGGGTTQSPQATAYKNPYLRSIDDESQSDVWDPSQYFA